MDNFLQFDNGTMKLEVKEAEFEIKCYEATYAGANVRFEVLIQKTFNFLEPEWFAI